MRKLTNDEISKEVSEKGVNVAVRLTKPTVKLFIRALKFFVGKPVGFAGRKISQKIHPTQGKQSVKTLVQKGQGVKAIPLADDGLKDFQKIAKKYGVDFAVVKDKDVVPPVYTIFFKAKDMDVITRIINDYSKKQLKEQSEVPRESIHKKLEKMKERVASLPKKILEKRKVMER